MRAGESREPWHIPQLCLPCCCGAGQDGSRAVCSLGMVLLSVRCSLLGSAPGSPQALHSRAGTGMWAVISHNISVSRLIKAGR